MEIVGILPTISSDYESINELIRNIFSQTLPPDLLVVVYQGDIKKQALFRKHVILHDKIHLITTTVKSLTYAKNLALDYLSNLNFKYCFVYEDDVVYPYFYNEKMIEILNLNKADMISAVQEIKVDIRSKIRSIFYICTHIYPLNDRRCFFENFEIGDGVFVSRYLYGGLSMYTKKVANEFRYDQSLTRYALGEDVDFSYRVSQNYKTIITNRIKAKNKSVGTKKFGYQSYFKSKISMWYYFFNKNIEKNLLSFFSLFVLFIAMFVESLLLSVIDIDYRITFYFLRDLYNVLFKENYSDFIKSGNDL